MLVVWVEQSPRAPVLVSIVVLCYSRSLSRLGSVLWWHSFVTVDSDSLMRSSHIFSLRGLLKWKQCLATVPVTRPMWPVLTNHKPASPRACWDRMLNLKQVQPQAAASLCLQRRTNTLGSEIYLTESFREILRMLSDDICKYKRYNSINPAFFVDETMQVIRVLTDQRKTNMVGGNCYQPKRQLIVVAS